MKPTKFVLLSAVLVSAAAQGVQYTAHDLGLVGGSPAISHGIVVGGSTSAGWGRAFYYCSGVMTTFGGALSGASDINAFGTIVGQFSTGDASHAFSYASGVLTDLGALSRFGSEALAINDAGTVVGLSWNDEGCQRAFSYSNGTMRDLGTLGSALNSFATDVNNAGTIVGSSDNAAFTYKNGTMSAIPGFRLANAINDADVVVGFRNGHAAKYQSGVGYDLGTLGGSRSCAYGINAAGTIVGDSLLSGDQSFNAFSYEAGVMTDLGPYLASIGLTGSSRATGIDDDGNIVGYAYASPRSGYEHGFLLSVVPEPSLGAMAVAALAVFLARGARNCNFKTRN